MFWYWISLVGEPTYWIIISLCLFALYPVVRKYRYHSRLPLKNFLYILLPSYLATMLLTYLLKTFVPVPRPCDINFNIYCIGDTSFPSGHSVTMATIVTSFCLVFRRKEYLVLYIAVFLVAISRVMLGVHRYEDVLAGLIIGIAGPLIFYKILHKRLERD